MSTPEAVRAKFGAYEILHELKTGGMGAVLLARRRGPGTFEQLVAIKTIRPEYASTPAVRAMFLDEAAILARTHHPAIAAVHDFGEEGGSLYMVMEYVPGIAFRELAEYQPPPTVCARAIVEAARGLNAAHKLHDLAGTKLGLVHRDISPDNLMLGFDGHVKVIDFGIALVKNRQAPVTEFGTLKGKPPYMSPEQVKNEPMDRRSDIFSLAVVLWELLTHRALFEGDSIYAIALAVQGQTILPPSQVLGEALPDGLDAAVMNALDRDPATRTQTAAELAERLEQVVQAAGGETLEAWAERALAQQRVDHRSWLASVVAGAAMPRTIGRATGQMTELAAIGGADTPAAPLPAVVAPNVPEPTANTSIGGTSMNDLSVPPRNRVAPIVIALLALLAVGGAIYVAISKKKATTPVVRDAAIADARPIDAELADAVLADAVPEVDAALVIPPPIDAGVKRTRDAGITLRPDAAVPKPDAAVTPTGFGLVTIRYKKGVYSNIGIDGAAPVAGPLVRKKLAAGKHTITFHEPKDSTVLDTQVIDVVAGEELDVLQR